MHAEELLALLPRFGSYTPVASNLNNLASCTPNVCFWIKVGDLFLVCGSGSFDPTAASTLTQADFTLPFACTFASSLQANGVMTRGGSTAVSLSGPILATASAGTVTLSFMCDTDVANRTWRFLFMGTLRS